MWTYELDMYIYKKAVSKLVLGNHAGRDVDVEIILKCNLFNVLN
jgi:hypothetical protein